MEKHQQEITSRETPFLIDELPFWSAPFGLALLETVRIRSRMQVLDIGSGYGFPLIELAQRLDTGSNVLGIDPSDECNAIVQTKIRDRGIGNARMIAGTAENLPCPDGSFDLIVSNNGLNNVQSLPLALRESHRVLKPGGQMVFTVNLPHTFAEFYEVYDQLLWDMDMDAEREKLKAHIYEKRKPPEYLRDLVLETGFGITSVQPEGFKYRFADGTSFLNHFMIRNFFVPPWKTLLPEDRAEPVFEELGKRLNSISSQSGFLEMSVPFIIFDLFKPES